MTSSSLLEEEEEEMNFSLISRAAAPAAVAPSRSSFPLMKMKNVVVKVKASSPFSCNASFFNKIEEMTDDPVLKLALKEPVAFVGGMFAGVMRLDLNEDPLRDWVSRTVQASAQDYDSSDPTPPTQQEEEEEVPQQIEIE